MSESREAYVKPELLEFTYEVDPSVTLAASCKNQLAATGPAIASCKNLTVGNCQGVAQS